VFYGSGWCLLNRAPRACGPGRGVPRAAGQAGGNGALARRQRGAGARSSL